MAAALAGPAAAQGTRVLVNNREVVFPDQQPVQRDARVYIPLRGVLDRIGAETIQWRPAREEVFIASGPREIRLRIGDSRALVDGREVDLDAPPILVGGRTMVPLRFIGENLGATVRWEGYTRTVHISVPQERVAGRRETIPDERDEEPVVRPRRNPRREQPAAEEVPLVIRPLRPLPGETINSYRPEITVMLRDPQDRRLDFDSIRMRVNGEDVTRDLEIRANSITYQPAEDLNRGVNTVQVTVRDRDGELSTRDWTFRIR